MIEAKADFESRTASLRIEGTAKDVFAETCMIVESIHKRYFEEDEIYANDFLTAVIDYLSSVADGTTSNIKSRTNIEMNPDFEKFLEDYQENQT